MLVERRRDSKLGDEAENEIDSKSKVEVDVSVKEGEDADMS